MTFELSKIRLFSFDFDGTLIQSNHIKEDAFVRVVLQYSKGDNSAVDIMQSIKSQNQGFDRHDIFKALEQKKPSLNANTLIDAYSEECERQILNAPEVAGATLFLETIKKHNKTIIINSATPKNALVSIVQKIHIQQYIDGIYGAPNTKAQNLIDAMSLYGVNEKQVLVIGDGENDRIAAEKIGCPFIGITNEYSDLDQDNETLHQNYSGITSKLNATFIGSE